MVEPLLKPLSRADEQWARQAAATKHRREVYRLVDRRDGTACRACGAYVHPFAIGLTERAEHHHVVLRSAGGRDETANVCLICASCHAARHRNELSVTGNADVTLTCVQDGRTWSTDPPNPHYQESTMKRAQIRQGDVFVAPTTKKPSAHATLVVDQGRTILAYGEVTGHAHEVVALAGDVAELPPSALFEEPDGTRVLLVNRPCLLRHEEHGPIALAPGAYRVTRQREYSPEEIRNVAD